LAAWFASSSCGLYLKFKQNRLLTEFHPGPAVGRISLQRSSRADIFCRCPTIPKTCG
jgi:hypothetical protein